MTTTTEDRMTTEERYARLAVVSTWPPKTCGIATFAQQLLDAVRLPTFPIDVKVLALTDPNDRLDFDNDVRVVIQREDLASLERAAEWIAASGADVVNLQHEFGLWGGFDGAFVVPFLERVQVPVLTVLHTVPFNAHAFNRAGRLELLGEIVRRSAHLITFLPVAREFLIERYSLDPARVSVLWHGAPAYPPLDRLAAKQELGLEGRTILTTLGLLNRFKGIDDALQALAELVAEEPTLVYLVLGRPHPAEPASLVPNLRRLANELGLGSHVRFVDHYLTEEEIQRYLAATDVYLAPYHDLSQTSSGTLTRALAAGRTAVATPFPLAQTALADGRGALAPPRDPPALAAALRPLITGPALRAAYERRARAFGEELHWDRVAPRFTELVFRAADARPSG